MKKTLVILKREYLTRVRTKAFVIGTLLTPFLLGALTILPGFLATRGGGERHITVLDKSGDPDLFKELNRQMGGASGEASGGGDQKPNLTHFTLTRVVVPPEQEIDTAYREPYRNEAVKDSESAY